MFENTRDHFHPGEGANAGELQAISWPVLVARLAAQRELRRVFLAPGNDGRASFNPGAAAWLSREEGFEQPGKRDVNRDALADGKQAWANTAGAASGAAAGDREKI